MIKNRHKIRINGGITLENKKEELAKTLDTMLSNSGYSEYIKAHLGEALDVARHQGTLIDLDHIIDLEEKLGFHVSYELYSYIDSQCDESLFDIKDIDELMAYVFDYINYEEQI